MPKTSSEIVRRALRECRVLGVDQDMPASYYTDGKEVLDGLYAELSDMPPRGLGRVLDWTVETVPDGLFLALSETLAHDLGRGFGRPFQQQRREESMTRLLSLILPDDAADSASDEDRKRASFY